MAALRWGDSVAVLTKHLSAVQFRRRDGFWVEIDEGFDAWRLAARECGYLFLIGNGASASLASHVAADLAKNAGIRTRVFSDFPLATAVSNDIGFEWVFAEPLRRHATSSDVLMAISSSGKSPNILKAVEVAREKGAMVLTLSAMEPDNPLRSLGDWNLYVPASTYGDAETCHAAILHHWINAVIDT